MHKTGVPIVLLLLGVAGTGFSAGPRDLSIYDWSATSAKNLAAHPPSTDAVAAFVTKLESTQPLETHLGVCWSRFADLRHSGNLSLVVSTSDGRFCDSSIFDKVGSRFEWYGFDPESEVVNVQDLSQDGKLEVVTSTDFTSYQGTRHCVAAWPVIYGWTGNGYSDVSVRYRAFYEHELSSLKKQIAASEAQKRRAEQRPVQGSESPVGDAAEQQGHRSVAGNSAEPSNEPTEAAAPEMVQEGPNGSFSVTSSGGVMFPAPPPGPPTPPPADKFGLDCTRAEASKIERFLGMSRDAGMSDAIRWANSDDPDTRKFAADVLADIAIPEAITYLKTLSHDSRRDVAMSAKSGLVQVSRGPEVHTVEQEPVSQAEETSGE